MNTILLVFKVLGIIALILGIFNDLYSLRCWLRSNRGEKGPSGIPGASIALYLIYSAGARNPIMLPPLFLFYAACHHIIPALHRRWIGGGESSD